MTGARGPALDSSSMPNGSSVNVRLHPADLDALADLVAERLAERLGGSATAPQLVDAGTLAGLLGVTRGYVYEHADDLGAQRIGNGPRPRLRFDVDRARELAGRLPGGEVPASGDRPASARHRRRRRPRASRPVPGAVPANDERKAA